MMDHTENRLRQHLAAVDSAPLAAADVVRARAQRAARRIARRRRAAAVAAAAALVVVAVGILSNKSAGPEQITGADGLQTTTSMPAATSSTTATAATEPFAAVPPGPRGAISGATVVWTGSEAVMIGGSFPDGGEAGVDSYDPETETWKVVSLGVPVGGDKPLALWTGQAVLLVGSGHGVRRDDLQPHVATYDPVTEQVTVLQGGPTMLSFYIDVTVPAAWTGNELLVWPTAFDPRPAPPPMAFDPVANSWRVLAAPPIEARRDAASVWTGTEWIVWGGTYGYQDFADGAAYDPVTDQWRLLAESPLAARRTPAVWTGSEMIVYGGSSGGDRTTGNGEFALADGAAYDPASDNWRSIAPGPAHPGFVPVWTGSLMIMFAKGGAVVYEPATDTWRTGEFAWGDVPHDDRSPVWTGSKVLLLGSYDGSTGGAVFDPSAIG